MSTREESTRLDIDWEKMDGLIPVVVQHYITSDILMLAYANRKALELTIENKLATFWSRSRKELWEKGSTSGDTLVVCDIFVDCDQDALIYVVRPAGEVCHTKEEGKSRETCFYRSLSFQDGVTLIKK